MCFFGFSFTPLSLSLGYFSYLPHVHHDLVPTSLPSSSRLECHMIMALFKFAETFIPPCYPSIVIPSGHFCYSTLSLARRRSTSPSHLMSSFSSFSLLISSSPGLIFCVNIFVGCWTLILDAYHFLERRLLTGLNTLFH